MRHKPSQNNFRAVFFLFEKEQKSRQNQFEGTSKTESNAFGLIVPAFESNEELIFAVVFFFVQTEFQILFGHAMDRSGIYQGPLTALPGSGKSK